VFGSMYARHLEVLTRSLRGMGPQYTTGSVSKLQSTYVRLLGVPEIGFRLRAVYFRHALRSLSKAPERILDAGSGIGAYAFWLARRYPAAEVIGCDIDLDMTSFCNNLRDELGFTNLEFVTGDIATDSGLRGFDLISCIDVLEHIPDYRAAIAMMATALKPGGLLYIHTPQTQQRRIFKRLADWGHVDHVREGFEVDDLRSQLVAHGLDVVNTWETFRTPGRFAWEINHLSLMRHRMAAALVFPIALAISRFDPISPTSHGLAMAITAQKPLAVGR
jgi:SAM-dependent methyltransferase